MAAGAFRTSFTRAATIRRVVVATVMLALLILGGLPAPIVGADPLRPAPAAAASGSGFRVDGSRIIGPAGDEFVPRGVNVNGYRWVWPGDTRQWVNEIVDCWGFDTIRVANHVIDEPKDWPVYDDNDDLDALVATFTSRGVVVILDAHDRTGGYYQGADLAVLTDWWRQAAIRYRDNPYVWFNLANEPGHNIQSMPDGAWLETHRSLLHVIRDEAGASNVVVVDGASWGQDLAAWSAGAIVDEWSAILTHGAELAAFGNVVFSFHAYEQWNFGDAKMADFIARAHQRNLAVLVGEYGSQNNESTLPAARTLHRVARAANVGRIAWAWWGGDANDLTTSGNGGGQHASSCSAPDNLTELGRLVWEDNHTPIAAGPADSVPPPSPPLPGPAPGAPSPGIVRAAGAADGYWFVSPAGQVWSFGGADHHGDLRAHALAAPIVGIAPTPGGGGYWLVGSDGGIFSFGDAAFFGSTGAVVLNRPIVGMASTPGGGGYWLVGSDGGIFSFG
ncbi:MAG: cellulase family glycosylhydrolase, partial [Acidimicrobiia bacterium]